MSDEKAPPAQPLLPEAAFVWVGGKEKWEIAYRTDYRRIKTITFVDNILFDTANEIYTSVIVKCAPFRNFMLLIDLNVTGAPTDIVIDVKFSDDRANFYKYMLGPFGDLRYEDTAGDKMECINGPIIAQYMQLKLTSSGGSGGNTFQMTVKAILTG
ncbi:MAG TPA: hypothetical protein ENH40_05685 [Nitrospirae bacterium]|nr:hypothetical protein [Nitrospirota bacterium]